MLAKIWGKLHSYSLVLSWFSNYGNMKISQKANKQTNKIELPYDNSYTQRPLYPITEISIHLCSLLHVHNR